jgi:hypothetical protein
MKPTTLKATRDLIRFAMISHNRKIEELYNVAGNRDAAIARRVLTIGRSDSIMIAIFKILIFSLSLDRVRATAATPVEWPLKAKAFRPQLVIALAPASDRKIVARTGRYQNNYRVSVPHFDDKKFDSFKLPDYTLGNWVANFPLSDGSRLVVNAATEAEAIRICKALAGYTKPYYRQVIKIEQITATKRAKPLYCDGLKVRAIRCSYYPAGKQPGIIATRQRELRT